MIVVIGKQGQLARALISVAQNTDVEIEAVGRPDCDLKRPSELRDYLIQLSPKIVINTAAYTDVNGAETNDAEAYQINALGAQKLANITRSLEIPIIQLSTDYVFDGSLQHAYEETAITNPLSVYGTTKLEGENRVREANPNHLIFRTSWIYSSFGQNFLKTMLRLALQRDEINVVSDQFGSPTSAIDLAQALLSIAKQVVGQKTNGSDVWGTYHLTGTGQATWAEFAELIFETSKKLGGPSATVKSVKTADYPSIAKRPKNSILNCSRAANTFDVQLPFWRESVRRCVVEILDKHKEAGT